jgi:hypothetical protein
MRKLNDHMMPGLSRMNAKMAGKEIKKELFEKFETMLDSKQVLTFEVLK